MSAAQQSDYRRFTDAVEAVYSYFKHHCGPESIVEHGPDATWGSRVESMLPEDVWTRLTEPEKEQVVAEVKGVRGWINEGYWTIASLPDPETDEEAYPALHRFSAELENNRINESNSAAVGRNGLAKYEPKGQPPLRKPNGQVDWDKTPKLEAAFKEGYEQFKHLRDKRRDGGMGVSIARYIHSATGYAISRREVGTHIRTYDGRVSRAAAPASSSRVALNQAYVPQARPYKPRESLAVRQNRVVQEALNDHEEMRALENQHHGGNMMPMLPMHGQQQYQHTQLYPTYGQPAEYAPFTVPGQEHFDSTYDPNIFGYPHNPQYEHPPPQ
ncbi:hypothetical protein JCM8547_002005 [Rhodosporidiobolus lusitaniae]